MMPLDLPPKPELWTPSRPAIIRASELPKSPAAARGIGFDPALIMVAPVRRVKKAAAFPIVLTTTSSVNNAGSTSHVVSLPSGVAVGDLVLVAVASFDDRTFTYPGSWVELFDFDAGDCCITAGYLIASGGETSVTLTSNNSTRTAHVALRISNYSGTPSVGTPASGSSASADPSSLTPGGGAKNFLWLPMCGSRRTADISSAPTNYTDLLQRTASSGPNVAIARRELNATSEDAGAFTLGSSVNWGAVMIAISPP